MKLKTIITVKYFKVPKYKNNTKFVKNIKSVFSSFTFTIAQLALSLLACSLWHWAYDLVSFGLNLIWVGSLQR